MSRRTSSTSRRGSKEPRKDSMEPESNLGAQGQIPSISPSFNAADFEGLFDIDGPLAAFPSFDEGSSFDEAQIDPELLGGSSSGNADPSGNPNGSGSEQEEDFTDLLKAIDAAGAGRWSPYSSIPAPQQQQQPQQQFLGGYAGQQQQYAFNHFGAPIAPILPYANPYEFAGMLNLFGTTTTPDALSPFPKMVREQQEMKEAMGVGLGMDMDLNLDLDLNMDAGLNFTVGMHHQPQHQVQHFYPEPMPALQQPYFDAALFAPGAGVAVDSSNIVFPETPKFSVETPRAKRIQREAPTDSVESARKVKKVPKALPKGGKQRPRKDPKAPWNRINATTKGSTRTAKINDYNADENYTYGGPVMKSWSVNGSTFRYRKSGELDSMTMSIAEIRDFLYEHPVTNHCRLKLWIQRMPADSGRRYPSGEGAKCRFRDCPSQVHVKGTIMHGHYRVCFDENDYMQGENADPYYKAGFVHLYCLERFLDFPDICNRLDVELDQREQMLYEPNRKFLGAVTGPDALVALDFIKRCKEGTLGESEKFADYPSHAEYKGGIAKPYTHEVFLRTLGAAMHVEKNGVRPLAQMRRFTSGKRTLGPTNVLTHLGDVEMYVLGAKAKKEEKAANGGRATKRKRSSVAATPEPELRRSPRTPKPSRVRQSIEDDFKQPEEIIDYEALDFDDEEMQRQLQAALASPRTPTRKSSRQHNRISYVEPDDDLFALEAAPVSKRRRTSD